MIAYRQDAKDAKMKEPDAKTDRWAHETIGVAIEVHKELGPGYDELIHENAMDIELTRRGIPFQRQLPVEVLYKGINVGNGKIDILVDGCLVLELKTVDALLPKHKAQVISYLKAKKLELGLLLNFKVAVMKDGIQRIVLSECLSQWDQ
jgi:GxxExxY protein